MRESVSKMKVGAIKVGPRFRKDMGDLDGLAASIRDVGLLHPIPVTPRGNLIAGARRLAAVKLLGWKTIPVCILDLENLLQAEHDENEQRLDFRPSERVAIVEALNPQTPGGDRKSDQSQDIANDRPTVDEAAKKAGFGNRETYRQASSVVANGSPELVEAMDAGEVSVSAAAEVATLPREEQRQVLAEGPEAVKQKAKEIRENRPQLKSPTPHSDLLVRWLKAVANETHIVNVERGGIAAMLSEPDKWNRLDVLNFILPMLDPLSSTIEEFRKEIGNAFGQDKGGRVPRDR